MTTGPRPAPQLSIGLNPFGVAPAAGWTALLDQARAVEAAGAHRVIVPDHVVLGPDVADYPWGTFPTGPEADWLEPLTVLTAMAAATHTVRLGTGVLVAPARHPVVLAKTVATLDVLSGGRVDLGVGTGWQEAELDAVGVPFADRGRRLTDTVEVCHALWRGERTTVETPSFTVRDVWCAPTPAQDRLPVWFSGSLTSRNVDRIVRLGDGWIPIMGTDLQALAEGAARLRGALAEAGRPADEIRIRAAVAPNAEAICDAVEAGATDVHVNVRSIAPTLEPAAVHDAVAALVAVLPVS